MSKRSIALFDIDETIISNDSMISLIRYSFKHHPKTRKATIKFVGQGIKYVFKLIDTKQVKQSAFECINYLTEKDLYKFYKQQVYSYIYEDAFKEIKRLKKEGYIVLLITASPECYMKYFLEVEEIDDVIGTRFEKVGSRFSNKIIGENCKGVEKVNRIHEWLTSNNVEIDYENSYAFSDSMSDLPMFKLVKNSYIINNKKADYNNKLYWK
ncbi:HAD family hydrolase [Niameybacter massiliensis]|uniref:HAD family hydrolase n=1 Tax=Niameybacter massiliensis TaxID=1658108 RepID=UPI0006B62569|nr:HAD family hydrolase [Niameybacter massiliensis]